jgi:uncharacterized membrane protein YbhN (UPF0104 family)
MPKTINHLVAALWLIYALHFDSNLALVAGLLWTTAYIVEVVFYVFLDFDRRTERLETSAGRLFRDSRGRFADLAPSDYDSPRKA